MDLLVGGAVGFAFVALAVGIGDLRGGGVNAMRRLGSRMDGGDKGGSGSKEVGCWGHGDAEVAADAAAEVAVDGPALAHNSFLSCLIEAAVGLPTILVSSTWGNGSVVVLIVVFLLLCWPWRGARG